jgi:hypothetical protein
MTSKRRQDARLTQFRRQKGENGGQVWGFIQYVSHVFLSLRKPGVAGIRVRAASSTASAFELAYAVGSIP